MPSFLSRYATPLTTGLFLVSLVSGLALFFHFESGLFHGMHEWLSLVLVVPFVLHVWKNWRSFVTYFKRPPMAIALAASLAAGIAFAVPAMTSSGEGGGRPPQRAIFEALENGRIADVAPLFGHDGASLAAALGQKGIAVADPSATVREVASASGKNAFEVIGQIAAAKRN